jgi:hypothetical protein
MAKEDLARLLKGDDVVDAGPLALRQHHVLHALRSRKK